jgi:hypothetical protein
LLSFAARHIKETRLDGVRETVGRLVLRSFSFTTNDEENFCDEREEFI